MGAVDNHIVDAPSPGLRDRLQSELDALTHELGSYEKRLKNVKAGLEDPSARIFGVRDPQFAIGEKQLARRVEDVQAQITRVETALAAERRRLIDEITAAVES